MKQDLQWWRRLWREFDGESAVLDEKWTNAERFSQLMGLGYFNMVIIFL